MVNKAKIQPLVASSTDCSDDERPPYQSFFFVTLLILLSDNKIHVNNACSITLLSPDIPTYETLAIYHKTGNAKVSRQHNSVKIYKTSPNVKQLMYTLGSVSMPYCILKVHHAIKWGVIYVTVLSEILQPTVEK